MGGLSLYRGVWGRRTQNFGNYSRGIVILQARMVPKVKRGHGGRVCPPETSFHHVNSSHWLGVFIGLIYWETRVHMLYIVIDKGNLGTI